MVILNVMNEKRPGIWQISLRCRLLPGRKLAANATGVQEKGNIDTGSNVDMIPVSIVQIQPIIQKRT
jgi:alpha-D-ribose 1-methylphosphonate 5-triphosphate diphosphatase PhnM